MPRGNNSPRGGRGRGGPSRGRGRGKPRGGGQSGVFDAMGDTDFNVIQLPPGFDISPGNAFRGGRGRGRGGGATNNNTPFRGIGSPRGGRGRGDGFSRGRGRGSGDITPNRRGGRGGGPMSGRDGPLSQKLYANPFLKPVVFVRSSLHATLFEEKEELLAPQPDEPDDDHVPTADRVFQIFHARDEESDSSSSSDEEGEGGESIEEIDFSEMARFREEVDSVPAPAAQPIVVVAEEEKFTGFFVDSNPVNMVVDSTPAQDTSAPAGTEPSSLVEEPTAVILEEKFTGFSIDSKPEPMAVDSATVQSVSLAPVKPHTHATSDMFFIDSTPSTSARTEAIIVETSHTVPMGMAEEEETIVYVAPHPRISATPIAPAESTPLPDFSSGSILAGISSMNVDSTYVPPRAASPEVSLQSMNAPMPAAPAFDSMTFKFVNQESPRKQPRAPPLAKSKARAKKREARSGRRKAERKTFFGRGASVSEQHLREEGSSRWEERRDDSDLDWGDVEGEVDATGAAEGMEVDPELNLDYNALLRFAQGMGQGGSQFVTMDDIADQQKIRDEDHRRNGPSGGLGSSGESSSASDSEDEEDAVVDEEERMLIAEPLDLELSSDEDEDDDMSEDSDDDLEVSPKSGFQARLERIRSRAKGKRPAQAPITDDEDDDEEDDYFNSTKGEEDEDFMAEIQSILDVNRHILDSRDRKARNRLFRAVRDGDFSDIDDIDVGPAKRKKDKGKGLPAHLQEQWQKDRERKAEFKRMREQAKLERAADPLSVHEGGKKGKKAMLAAAKLDPSIIVPHRIVNLQGVEQQIRRFLADIGGKPVMSLPPMDKTTRKAVHEMAICFNLTSKSKGKGDNRYTCLTKTTRSGIAVNERKIQALLRRSGGGYTGAGTGGYVGPGAYDRGGNKGKSAVPRHKDGDLVGQKAPKLSDSNIGFKMLALMGWSEGDKIGMSGGIEVPITATIKNTKLGLGAR